MKTPLAVLFIALIGLAAFMMGRGKSGGQVGKEITEPNTRTVSSQSVASTAANAWPKAKPRIGPDVLTVEKAAQLTPEERIAMLKKAALLADPEKQADILCGLISAMTQDELVESTRSLLDAQRKGNAWSQEVWNALWTQWGRVNPEACLALSKTGERYPGWNGLNGLNTYNDYRCLMAGWLEVHPEKAMDWAKQPKDNMREAMGSAFAITSSANGDLKQMEAAILSMSGDDMTMKACFNDYFDLANSNGEKPAALYERMDAKLREAAWTETIERLSQGNLDEAASWYAKHGSDPGSDSQGAANLIVRLSEKDPAGTLKWASDLPAHTGGPDGRAFYPAEVAFALWRERDRDAANEWLNKQSVKTPWISRMLDPAAGNEPPELPGND
ncbi:MAG: hypothetical protein V4689_08925 [Verrucomicrobiota bacterium]